MAERFVIKPDGSAVPYVPQLHDAPKDEKPQPHFSVGDRVFLTGIVTENVNSQGPLFNVRVQTGNNTLWIQEHHLKQADEAARFLINSQTEKARQDAVQEMIVKAAKEKKEEEKALHAPPATRHLKQPKETK